MENESPSPSKFDHCSYDTAVWQWVFKDIRVGWRNGGRMVVQSCLTLGIGFYLLSRYASDDAPTDFLFERVLVIPAAAVVFMILHFFWSWSQAPREIFQLQKRRIANLQPAVTKPVSLRITFGDPPADPEWVFDHRPERLRVQPAKARGSGFNGAHSFVGTNESHADYSITKNTANPITKVRFIIRGKDGEFTIYAKVATTPNKDALAEAWLIFSPPRDQPMRNDDHGAAKAEWFYPAVMEPMKRGWREFTVDIPRACEETSARDGMRFVKLEGFRIRGTVDLAVIECS